MLSLSRHIDLYACRVRASCSKTRIPMNRMNGLTHCFICIAPETNNIFAKTITKSRFGRSTSIWLRLSNKRANIRTHWSFNCRPLLHSTFADRRFYCCRNFSSQCPWANQLALIVKLKTMRRCLSQNWHLSLLLSHRIFRLFPPFVQNASSFELKSLKFFGKRHIKQTNDENYSMRWNVEDISYSCTLYSVHCPLDTNESTMRVNTWVNNKKKKKKKWYTCARWEFTKFIRNKFCFRIIRHRFWHTFQLNRVKCVISNNCNFCVWFDLIFFAVKVSVGYTSGLHVTNYLLIDFHLN